MLELTAKNAERYLLDRDWVGAKEVTRVTELTGGVSNVVLLVETRSEGRFVLKQAREQLQVAEPWFCSVERIWREAAVLRTCRQLLDEAGLANTDVPEILHSDRENYLFAMTAAPAGSATWKEQLMAGQFSSQTAQTCGSLLGTLHAGSWQHPQLREELSDRTYFRELRVAPYYEFVAAKHADVADPLLRLAKSLDEHRACLTHADFSPKNLLVAADHVTLIDCEVGHFGDGAFDLGFLLTHLVLKAIVHHPRHDEVLGLANSLLDSYFGSLNGTVADADAEHLSSRAVGHLGGCLLARVDGKSPVDYLDPNQQSFVRQLSRQILRDPPGCLSDALTVAKQQIDTL